MTGADRLGELLDLQRTLVDLAAQRVGQSGLRLDLFSQPLHLGRELRALGFGLDPCGLGLEDMRLGLLPLRLDGGEFLGQGQVPATGGLEALIERGEDLLEFANLAFLLEQRGVERGRRTANDDAGRLHPVALEGDERGLPGQSGFPQRERALEVFDHHGVAEQRAAQGTQVAADLDEVGEAAEHTGLFGERQRCRRPLLRGTRSVALVGEVQHLERALPGGATDDGALVGAVPSQRDARLQVHDGPRILRRNLGERAAMFGDKRRPAFLLALEQLDPSRTDLRTVDDHALEAVPEHSADRSLEVLWRVHVVGEDAVDRLRRPWCVLAADAAIRV